MFMHSEPMEAAVLNLALMQPEVDCNSNSLSAELEVRKLQALVRKLERQNEQLRTRAGAPLPASPYRLPELLLLGSVPPQDQDQPLDYFDPHTEHGEAGEKEQAVLDDLELLDLDSMCSSDDSQETWLYISQKSTESSDHSLTPLQWCRHALDRPRSELEVSRRSLSLRMEQVSRWRSSLSSPSHSSSPPPSLSRVSGTSPISASPSAKPCSTPQSDRHAPSLSSPLHPVLQRTLSPVAKDLSPVAERAPTFLPHLSKRSRSLQRTAFTPESSADDEDSLCLGFKLQDLTDVQVMARMQEESLRQDLALAPRRSHSLTSFSLSGAPSGLEEEDEEEEEEDEDDCALLPPPAPRLTRLPHSHTFSSFSDWPRGSSSSVGPGTPPSTPSTPRHLSAGFAFHTALPGQPLELGLGSPSAELGFRTGSDETDNKLRRSLPNLVRAPSMPCVPLPATPSASPSLLRSSQSFDLSSGLSRLHSPSPLQSAGSFSSLSRPPLKATAYVSPTIKGSAYPAPCGSGIPLLSKHTGSPAPARSGLPRPASFVGTASSTPRGKLGQSGRSFLTPPKSLSTLSALRDSAWRDGCY